MNAENRGKHLMVCGNTARRASKQNLAKPNGRRKAQRRSSMTSAFSTVFVFLFSGARRPRQGGGITDARKWAGDHTTASRLIASRPHVSSVPTNWEFVLREKTITGMKKTVT